MKPRGSSRPRATPAASAAICALTSAGCLSVLITQQLGFSIEDIRAALATLPAGRAPTQKDWERISRNFRGQLDERISRMTRLRDYLDGCIGCGCLSLGMPHSDCRRPETLRRGASLGARRQACAQQLA